MNRNKIEIITTLIWGAIACLFYVPFFGFVSVYTTNLYGFLEYIPCQSSPCILKLIVFWLTSVVFEALIGLPLFFIFGILLGYFIRKFHISRALILCIGFFSFHFYYGYSLFYIEIIRALPIIFLFIIFTKLGYLIKLKMKQRTTDDGEFVSERHKKQQ